MKILGLSAFYHDSAAALVINGEIAAAAQEERFTRKKHYSGFPERAITYCLESAGINASDLDHVAFYDKPFLKFERLLETYLAFAPRGFASFCQALPVWLKEKLFQKNLLARELVRQYGNDDWLKKLLFTEHHQSHAASAFFPSPFDEAAVLTMDGVGEWTTTSTALGIANKLELTQEIHFPHSLGLLYSAFTYYTGFKVNSGEYKVMGLAPYGEPRFSQTILDNLIDVKADGSFRLNMSYFNYCTGLTMTNQHFNRLFGGVKRAPGETITQVHMDLAASVQAVAEEIVLRMSRSLAKSTGMKNLCLAGGVALNCVANGKVFREGMFENVWVQPAAGDAGGALGAALSAHYGYLEQPRKTVSGDAMRGSYLGPEFSSGDIEARLIKACAKFTTHNADEVTKFAAQALAEGKAVGWFQGRMEFGPRALGNRSILGDPRSPTMQSKLNLKVKNRESFRPFAPSVLREEVSEWFEIDGDSPYMLMVADVIEGHRREMTQDEQALFGFNKLNVHRSDIPAVTHVDYSARIQTVNAETNPRFHALIREFQKLTDCPVVVNTSFNVRGEPIVCTPEDAFHCFMGTEIEVLIMGDCLLRKEDQDPALKPDYSDALDLD